MKTDFTAARVRQRQPTERDRVTMKTDFQTVRLKDSLTSRDVQKFIFNLPTAGALNSPGRFLGQNWDDCISEILSASLRVQVSSHTDGIRSHQV